MKIYGMTGIGRTGTMTYGGLISLGEEADESGYERFAAQVTILEQMEAQGQVRIIERHRESSTGMRHLDLVRFERLA